MKAIGVLQPWADLVLRGIADVVKVPFSDPHRGRTLLCATDEGIAWETAAFYQKSGCLEEHGVLGVVDVVDVVAQHPSPWSYPDEEGFVWVLANPKRLPFKKHRVKKTSVFDVTGVDLDAIINEPRPCERPPIHPKHVAFSICALAVQLEVESLRDIAEDIDGVELPRDDLAARRAFVANLRSRAGHVIRRLSHDELVRMMRACGDNPRGMKDHKMVQELGAIFGDGLPPAEFTHRYRARELEEPNFVIAEIDDDDEEDEDDEEADDE